VLAVLAAGSLRAPFESLARHWRSGHVMPVTVSYDNARELAARIAAGEPADVFASASPEHPAVLRAQGVVEPPRPFASNRLVVAVPSGSHATDASVLAAPGCRVVVEAEGIPLGDYTRNLLGRLEGPFGAGFAGAALANVVREELTVAAVAERLLAGDGDAGVLYNTDVAASDGRLRAIEVPTCAEVRGTYVIATVRRAGQLQAAREWVELVSGATGQRTLLAAGFDQLCEDETVAPGLAHELSP
jgi:molybdate transport system substrate-binding protein